MYRLADLPPAAQAWIRAQIKRAPPFSPQQRARLEALFDEPPDPKQNDRNAIDGAHEAAGRGEVDELRVGLRIRMRRTPPLFDPGGGSLVVILSGRVSIHRG